MKKPLFEPGKTVATAGVYQLMQENPEFARFVSFSLSCHLHGFWGDLCESDKRINNEALKTDGRLLSAYSFYEDHKIWIITESDRSATTVLFPDEY